MWGAGGEEVIILESVSRKYFTDKVTFEYRSKRDEGASLAGVQGKGITRKRTASTEALT